MHNLCNIRVDIGTDLLESGSVSASSGDFGVEGGVGFFVLAVIYGGILGWARVFRLAGGSSEELKHFGLPE
jgi:hypothetical protein